MFVTDGRAGSVHALPSLLFSIIVAHFIVMVIDKRVSIRGHRGKCVKEGTK